MRLSLLLVCLFTSSSVGQVRVGTQLGPGEDHFYPIFSGQLSFRPYYATPGVWRNNAPPSGVAPAIPPHDTYRVYDWNRPVKPRDAISPPRGAAYAFYPNYPGLNYSNPQDVRPSHYELPPMFTTPYHDPYFEERFWDGVRDGEDVGDYWGW